MSIRLPDKTLFSLHSSSSKTQVKSKAVIHVACLFCFGDEVLGSHFPRSRVAETLNPLHLRQRAALAAAQESESAAGEDLRGIKLWNLGGQRKTYRCSPLIRWLARKSVSLMVDGKLMSIEFTTRPLLFHLLQLDSKKLFLRRCNRWALSLQGATVLVRATKDSY